MIYKFQNFTLNTITEVLESDNEVIKLINQDLILLIFFLENPGRIFSKQEIISKAWQGRHVTQNSVDQSVSKLRKILSQYQSRECIKTVYARGFIFDVKVNRTEDLLQKSVVKSHKLLVVLMVFVSISFLYSLP